MLRNLTTMMLLALVGFASTCVSEAGPEGSWQVSTSDIEFTSPPHWEVAEYHTGEAGFLTVPLATKDQGVMLLGNPGDAHSVGWFMYLFMYINGFEGFPYDQDCGTTAFTLGMTGEWSRLAYHPTGILSSSAELGAPASGQRTWTTRARSRIDGTHTATNVTKTETYVVDKSFTVFNP